MKRNVKTSELFDSIPDVVAGLFEGTQYPWEVLAGIKEYILKITEGGLLGYDEIADGVWIGENAKVAPTATIEPPCIIGKNTEIRPGAYIRGSVITGEGCVIGNSSELKNCILMDNVQVPHYNYVGDSVLGNHSHMGAGSICSNLKADGKAVVIHGDREYITGIRKVGGFLGDYADVGCGCVLNPGTVIGKNTSVYPLNSLRGVYPPGSIVKNGNDKIHQIRL